MKKIIFMMAFCTGTSCLLNAQEQERVIYGEDNRLEIHEVKDQKIVELASATAAMVLKDRLSQSPKESQVVYEMGAVPSLRDFGACEEERFSKQPTLGGCSGFLVGPRTIVTAGHCIQDQNDCNRNYFVFDYALNSKDQSETSFSFPKNSVYSCKKVLVQKLGPAQGDDYSVVELDRPVEGRMPLQLRKEGSIETGESIFVIGHPTGLPSKYADGAKVRKRNEEIFFQANLDTYGGNSGSAVFNSQTKLVEGILVAGETDYAYRLDLEKRCLVSNRCSDNDCRGEDVVKINSIPNLRELIR